MTHLDTQAWTSWSDLPAVPEAVQRTRDSIAALYRHPAVRRGKSVIAAAAIVRAARVSAILDGGVATIDPAAGAVLDPVLAGSLRVAAEVGGMVRRWPRAPLQVLARLHVLAAAGLIDAQFLGRPRQADQVSGRLAELAAIVVAAPWPGPIMVAAVHAELLGMLPFGVADGVVARAAARLTMVTSGLDPDGLSVPEVGHLRDQRQYREGIRSYSAGAGPVEWILHVCDALVAGAAEARSMADTAGPSPRAP